MTPRALPLALFALSLPLGCSADAVIDLENARNEARFVPAEVVGTLGFAVAQARNYGERAVVAQNALSVGNSPDEEGCSAVSVTDNVLDDGIGAVLFDFNACPGRTGQVLVDQESTLPQLPAGWEEWDQDDWDQWDGELPDGWDGPNTPGGDGERQASFDLPSVADENSYTVRFVDYSVSIVEVKGAVDVSEGVSGGEIGAHIGVSALDYNAVVSVAGRWTPMTNEPGEWVSFGGRFNSMTGVEWTVVADNLGFLDGDCQDAVGGTLTAIFENEAGRTTVTATFDDVCDGCAHVAIDGIDQGQACFSASELIGS
jgi:hypothetical protein